MRFLFFENFHFERKKNFERHVVKSWSFVELGVNLVRKSIRLTFPVQENFNVKIRTDGKIRIST